MDRYCSYIIIKCVIIDLPELINVVVQLRFLQYALHHGDQNSLVSERWERCGGWRVEWGEGGKMREEEEEEGEEEGMGGREEDGSIHWQGNLNFDD